MTLTNQRAFTCYTNSFQRFRRYALTVSLGEASISGSDPLVFFSVGEALDVIVHATAVIALVIDTEYGFM